MLALPVRACLTMEQDRQRLLEDRKALRDAIKNTLAINDDEEVKCLTKRLNCLEKYLKGDKNENSKNPDVPAGA